jgi:hypothetical protein
VSRRVRTVLVLAACAVGATLVPLSSGGLFEPEKPTLSTSLLPWSRDTSATFQFSGSPDTVRFVCRLDSSGSDLEDCTSPVSYSPLPEGQHTFEVVGVDADEARSAPATFDWTIDLTPPTTPSDIIAEATSPAGAIVDFRAADNLDPSPSLSCSQAPSTVFPLGSTTVTCTATDAAGNVSPSGTFAITVRDTTPPTVAPHADVIAPQDRAQGALVSYSLPSAQDAADPSPSVRCDPAPGGVFPIGETQVACRATDAAGRTSAPTTFEVIVQAGPAPAKPGLVANVTRLTNRPSSTFRLTVEPDVSVECRLDGPFGSGSFSPCASATSQSYTGLDDGAHLFTVQVTNAIGNVNQASYGWVVDLTAPASVRRFAARGGHRRVRLTWTRPIDVDYDRVRIWRKRASATAWKRLVDRVTAASFTDRTVSNHVRYRYRIRSLDKARNASAATVVHAWASPLFSPRHNAVVHSPPLVDWRSVRRARYYNMQVWRDGRKLLSVWPGRSHYRLRSRWTFRGRTHMLAGGRVVLYVWAGFGPKAAARYGPLYGQTTFRLG